MNFKKTAAIVAAAGALTALAVPAMAEFTPYLSVRLLTGYQINDPNTTGSKVDGDLFFKMPNSSRFGVKASDGALGGVVEFGINEDGGNIVNRLMYGTYKMSGGTLLVGQDYTKSWNPSAVTTEDRPSNGGWGNFYAGRLPQIRFQFDNGLYLAAIQPATVVTTPASGVNSNQQELYLPKLNVGYDGKTGDVGYGAGAEFQTYKNDIWGKQVNALLVYARANMVSGPIALKANLGYGMNLGNLGYNAAGSQAAVAELSGGSVKNASTIEGYVQAGYTVSPTLKLQAIVGGQSNKNTSYKKADNRLAVSVNAPVTIAKNFTVTPEVAYFDELKDRNDKKEKKDYFVGAKWQLDF